MILTESEMLRIARVGTGQARRAILNRDNVIPNELDLDDMRQCACIRLWIKNGNQDKPFSYWLTIARNAALQYYARKITPGIYGLVYHGFLNTSFNYDIAVLRPVLRPVLTSKQKKKLHELLLQSRKQKGKRALRAIEREIFILDLLTQDRSNIDIAQALGTTPGIIHNARRNLLQRLKTILESTP